MYDEKISIVIPIYNVEKYVKRCIDSVLAQTYKNIEIILVDDGSEDNCGEICDEYAKSNNYIKVLHQENSGLAAARNNGIKITTGDYIAFVDSDDYVLPQMYEILYKNMKNYDADISTCNRYRNINNKNDYENMDTDTEKIHVFTGQDAAKHLLSDTRFLKPAAWVVASEKQLYAYSIRDNSIITSDWNKRKIESYYFVTNECINYFKNIKNTELEQAALYWCIQFGIEAYERMRKSSKLDKTYIKELISYIKEKRKQLHFRQLDFSLKKYIKKYVEYGLFTNTPYLLYILKNRRF